MTNEGLSLIKKYEGCRLTAFKGVSGTWLIGYGNSVYEDGKKVSEGDKITQERADKIFESYLEKNFVKPVSQFVKSKVNDNMFSALVSLSYGIGLGNFFTSTLLKKVNANPNDPTIVDEFKKWNKLGTKVVQSLTRRRIEETNLYFKK